ncbi:MAG TPA: hypothetical protein VE955_05565, partial [Candidatus Dormibacteraeota bacterium]|nr:hypothetical protein [Candidatus Dormibacteraeota bacterium]
MRTRPSSKSLLILAVLLVLAVVPTALLSISATQSNHSLNPTNTRNIITPNAFVGRTQLGIDCGLGSTIQAANSTGFPLAPSEVNPATATLQSRCTWIGDVSGAADTTNEPLVTDQDEAQSLTSPNIGGGFTASVVVIQNSSSIVNGFDLQLTWNPNVLRAVEFDQTNEPTWTPNILVAPVKTIDNTNGIAELAQVISGTANGNLTLFRMRFDVVGVGVTNLNIVNVSGGLTNPGPVVHDTHNGSFDSESVFDPGHTLNWVASFKNTTVVNPGGSTSFSATIAGGVAPYTVAWQFDSCNQSGGLPCTFTSQATGNPVTVPTPNPCTAGVGCDFRIDVQVTDAASNVFHMVQHIPLTTILKDTTTPSNVFAINVAQTFGGFWVGGFPTYTGSQRFCPGTTANGICTVPTASIAATSNQQLSRAVTYKLGGVYTDTQTITDSNPAFAGGQNSVTYTLIVNATGSPFAYTLTLTANATTITVNHAVLFTVSAAYFNGNGCLLATNTGFLCSLRPTSITFNMRFGDGSTGSASIPITRGGSNSTTLTHTYIATSPTGNPFSAFGVGADGTISKIQETSNRIGITVSGAAPLAVTISCPATGTVGTAVTCTASATGGTAPYTFSWTATGGSPATGTGTSFSTTYSSKGSKTISVTGTDSATPTPNSQTQSAT